MNNLPPLSELAAELTTLKNAEDNVKLERLRKEQQILEHPDIVAVLKDEGSVTVEGVGVSTGFSRKWNQAQLIDMAKTIDPAYWPFKLEWKEDRAEARVIEEKFPELWAQIRDALTLNPKKPAVAIKPPTKKAA